MSALSPRAISILQFKGGVGKSTLTQNLGHCLSLDGKRVLLIDCDIQAHTSTLLPQVRRPTLTDVLTRKSPLVEAMQEARPNLFVVPSDQDLDTVVDYLVKGGDDLRLQREVQALRGIDYVLFDHSPSYTRLTRSCLYASDALLIPIDLEPLAMEGLLMMFDKLNRELTGHAVEIAGYVPMKFHKRRRMHEVYLEHLIEFASMPDYRGPVLPAVRTSTVVPNSQSRHQTVFEYRKKSAVGGDFQAITTALEQAAVPA